ncbi:Signal recognition particle receptor FtsY [Olavius algarvensis associated proteobacterium Delta 3]|nr:Signal recognition particle receptor FtsY [Olavius algarvensis associated proteobacterium Delta 3]
MKLFRQKKKDRNSASPDTGEAPTPPDHPPPTDIPEPAGSQPSGVLDSDEPHGKSGITSAHNAKETGRKGLFGRLRSGLKKTRDILTTDIDDLFLGKRRIDDDMLEDLEELLITSDIGVQTTMEMVEGIRKRTRSISGPEELKTVMKEEVLALMSDYQAPTFADPLPKPYVVMVLGVNGVGKTTTIGKLAALAASEGKKVLIAASDTFRAAATEQLTIWAERAGADLVSHRDGADPAAVAYDGIEAALSRKVDIVFIDTAGRLHTKVNLMAELKKIKRTITKKLPEAPHEVLLVLDATTGQNALSQAAMFNDEMKVTAIALTKLDGTAKGGIVVSICSQLKIPLKYIGVGEKIDDLQAFDPEEFADALFSPPVA